MYVKIIKSLELNIVVDCSCSFKEMCYYSYPILYSWNKKRIKLEKTTTPAFIFEVSHTDNENILFFSVYQDS